MNERDEDSFTLARYLKDRLPMALVWALCIAALCAASLILGVTPWGAALLCLLVVAACGITLAWDYVRKNAYYNDLQQAVRQLNKVRYLRAFVAEPYFLEGRLCWNVCDTLAYVSDCELAQATQASESYERYIKTWIHEIKTPIAASRLVLARMRGPEATALRQELESIERFVEQVLYYARSQHLSVDYAIRELVLAEVVREACKRNQNLLIACGTTPAIHVAEEHRVFCDRSWLTFIMGQLLSNAAKYGAGTIRITSQQFGEGTSGCVRLEVADDGVGIPSADMPRIFDQGFVGANGRAEGSATGMGLYLCSELCQAMGIDIDAYSEEGKGTRIVLTFPVNREMW